MTVGYHGPREKPDAPYRYYADLVEMAAAVDVLAPTCPGNPSTEGLVDARVLDALGPAGILVNVARGSVANEAALVDALAAGQLGGAELDVYADEPHVPAALIDRDDVMLTPHLGSGTVASRMAMGDMVIENLRRHFAGEPLLTPV